MKKIVNFMLCLIMMVTLGLSVRANDDYNPWNDHNSPHRDNNQHHGQSNNSHQSEGSEHEHSYSYAYENDTATCENPGIIVKICSCGQTAEESSPAKGHQFDNCVNHGENHESACSRCGYKVTEAHSYGEWTSSHSRECTLCHATETGSHSMKDEVVRQPTCKEEGTRRKYCTVCAYSETVVLTKLTTHTYDSACDAQCNVCSRTRDIEHTFTTTWSKDYEGHWFECTKCAEKSDYSKHTAGSEATEEKDQVCVICNYIITAKKTHEHSYEQSWTSDKAGHWHACSGKNCGSEKDYTAHVFDDDCDPQCNTCDYERENSHSYDTDGWKTTNFEHWNICSTCGEESKHEKHVPGPEASDENAQVCTICNYELSPKLEHSHDFGTAYIGRDDSHWQECECGELSVPEDHVWDNGTKKQNKTIIFRCVLCGTEKMEAASSGFSWVTILLILLAMICMGGIAVLVFLLKRGSFEEDHEQEEMTEDPLESADAHKEDEEDKMIDDFFASLDE